MNGQTDGHAPSPFDARYRSGTPADPRPRKGRHNKRPLRDPNDPVVAAQQERIRLLRIDGRTNAAGSNDMPPLPRRARGGDMFFSSRGLVDAACGRVAADAIVEARQDAAFMLDAAYRPGAENVVLVTWARIAATPDDVSPIFDASVRGYRPAEIVLVAIGYTGRRLNRITGGDFGAQCAMILAPVEMRDGVPYAVPTEVYDLTIRTSNAASDLAVLDCRRKPLMAAIGAVGGYNLADTVRRFADPATARYGSNAVAGTGPLVSAIIHGTTGVHGGPMTTTTAIYSILPQESVERIEEIKSGNDDLLLSFSHLGPATIDRGIPPTIGTAPWVVVEGNVFNIDAVYGDVTVTSPRPA